tara:strand:+ start:3850 stop:4428 length:579 start_codon:yes stop_codon:yes gene_type:complete
MDDDYFNEKISLDDLYTREKEVKNNKIKTFQKILTRVHKKIKLASRNNIGDKHIFFLVPEFIIGVPSYDVNLCTSYLMEKLNENGFKIKYTHPNLLFISWGHYIPDYQRREIKKKHGVIIDGFGNVKQSKENEDKNNSSESENPNDLILHTSANNDNNKKNKQEYKKLNKYKPSGKFIYSDELMKSLEKNID